mgnify:FL=1
MKNYLRYAFIAVLAFICNVSFGQTLFDFDKDYKTLFPNLPGVSSSSSKAGDFTEATTCTVDGIKVTISKKASGSNENRIWASSPRLRMYSGTMTIEAPEGKKISGITFTFGKWNTGNKSDVGTLTDKGVWKGDANKVVATIAGNTQLKSLIVTLAGTVITYKDVPSVKDLLTNYTSATTSLNLKLTNAKVIYVNTYNKTVNTYVREGDAAIELRTLGFDMPLNSTISGTVKVDLDYSYGVPYLKANDATNDESLNIQESTEEAQPIVATVADLNAKKYMNDLVIVKDVKLSTEKVTSGTSTRTNYYINDGDAKVQLYDKFQVSDLATLTDGETYTVQGLFGQIYKDVPEILMTKKVKETTGITNITTEAADANAPAYNLAGQKVGKEYKGVVIKAGKKFIQK